MSTYFCIHLFKLPNRCYDIWPESVNNTKEPINYRRFIPLNVFPGNDTNPSNDETRAPELWGMWSTPSLSLLSSSLLMVVPVRVSSVGQIVLFNHLLYLNLKPFNCVQTND